MKYPCFLLLLYYLAPVSAQDKYDHVWMTGYFPNNGGLKLDFNSNPESISTFELPEDFQFSVPCSISDENGNLQFYANGCQIYNAQHELIENGDDLAPGAFHNIECHNVGYGYDAYQNMVIIPRPGHPGRYVYFHPTIEMDIASGTTLVTEIDMFENQGRGKVISKNVLLRGPVKREAVYCAVRHGNGRDWWVVIPEEYVNVYNAYLVTPDTILGPFRQDWENSPAQYGKAGWASNFSPDGTRFARTAVTWNDSSAIFLYDFDRCSGTLCNPKRIFMPQGDGYGPWVVFSPNSRFLYLQFEQRKIYQYDLWAEDIEASAIPIGEYDGFTNPNGFAANFHSMALTPNGEIYICTTSGIRYFHSIQKPDERGAACAFQLRKLELPANPDYLMPHFPNFRLYDIPGSYCDTLGIDSPYPATPLPPPSASSFRLFPNPASVMVNVLLYAAQPGNLRVYNTLGQLVYEHGISGAISTLCFSVENWPAGAYFVEISQEGQKRLVQKLVVAHGRE